VKLAEIFTNILYSYGYPGHLAVTLIFDLLTYSVCRRPCRYIQSCIT